MFFISHVIFLSLIFISLTATCLPSHGDAVFYGETFFLLVAVIKRNHFKMYMFGVVGETHAHDYFEFITFYNSKDI